MYTPQKQIGCSSGAACFCFNTASFHTSVLFMTNVSKAITNPLNYQNSDIPMHNSFFYQPLAFQGIISHNTLVDASRVNREIESLMNYFQTQTQNSSPFIHLYMQNTLKAIVAFFAIIRSGKICVLIDNETKKLEQLDIERITPPSLSIHLDSTNQEFDYRKEVYIHGHSDFRINESCLSQICLMIYTAAEDGYAKPVMLSEKNILAVTDSIIAADHLGPQSCSCALTPLSHLYGLQCGLLAPLRAGGFSLLIAEQNLLRVNTVSAALREWKVTNLYSVPVVYHLLKKIDSIKTVVASITSCVSGGYVLHPQTYHSFLQASGKNIRNGYGLTEASPICTWHRPEDTIKVDSIGRSFPCCSVSIQDETDTIVPTGTVGEICVQGTNVFSGYYGLDAPDTHVLRDGWLHTGDWGMMDRDGYVYFRGLKKKMFNCIGKNVYPEEVKRLFCCYPLCHDVRFRSIDDPVIGHTIEAIVVLSETSPAIQTHFKQWCKQHVAPFKIPQKIHFVDHHQFNSRSELYTFPGV